MNRVLVLSSIALVLVQVCAPAADTDNRRRIPPDARAILEKADTFELLSLHPTSEQAPRGSFHGYEILGKTEIARKDVRTKLVEAFEKAVEKYDGDASRCFSPRHGIRVKHDGKTVDFVICFECSQVQVFAAGHEERYLIISDAPTGLFNKVLTDAGAPLPPAPDK